MDTILRYGTHLLIHRLLSTLAFSIMSVVRLVKTRINVDITHLPRFLARFVLGRGFFHEIFGRCSRLQVVTQVVATRVEGRCSAADRRGGITLGVPIGTVAVVCRSEVGSGIGGVVAAAVPSTHTR